MAAQEKKKTKKVAVAFDNLVAGYLFTGKSGKQYEVVGLLGKGGMGAVYVVKELGTGDQYAIKTEKREELPKPGPKPDPKADPKAGGTATNRSVDTVHRILQRRGLRIAMEKLTLKACRRSLYFPRYKDAGRTEHFGWIAMELVGKSLYDLWTETKYQKFSAATTIKIALAVIRGLRDLHSQGFVHRDLKPDNLAAGLGAKNHRIYILDTGISRQYKNVAGVPLKPRMKIKFQGSKDYSPLAMQREHECGPRDDIESLFYILALFLTGKLPWTSTNNDKDILLLKFECRNAPHVLFHDSVLSPHLSELWRYNATLKYEDEVDYSYLIESLRAVLRRLGCARQPLDWETKPAAASAK